MRALSRLLPFCLLLVALAACTTRPAAPPPGITPLTLEQDRMMRE